MQRTPVPDSEQAHGRALGGELVIPALAFAFTIYYFVSIHEAPWTAKASTYFIGGVLLALVVLFVGSSIKALASGVARLSFAGLRAPAALAPKRLGLLALVLVYVYALEFGGFTITTFVFLFLAMVVLGGLKVARTAVLLAASYALGGYILFIALFETRFPEGPFEVLMKAVLP